MTKCPCGSDINFDACCEPIIAGTPALTAEALMRSRYSAYVKGNIDHIEKTHGKEVRDDYNRSAAESMANSVKWLSLDIRETTGGGTEDNTGTVEFAATFHQDGEDRMHHERSDFKREQGQWVYTGGQMNPRGEPRRVQKVGRNEPCPCGSGKKFKKCCGAA